VIEDCRLEQSRATLSNRLRNTYCNFQLDEAVKESSVKLVSSAPRPAGVLAGNPSGKLHSIENYCHNFSESKGQSVKKIRLAFNFSLTLFRPFSKNLFKHRLECIKL
jgi:hypothetical protein